MATHQDWTEVVFKKTVKQKQKQIDPIAKKMNQLDNDTGEKTYKIETVSKSDISDIIKCRTQLKLTRDDLATKLSINKDIIRDIETGSYPKNNKLISRIKKFLSEYKVPES